MSIMREREREDIYHTKSGCLTGKSLTDVSYIFITYDHTRFRKKVKGVFISPGPREHLNLRALINNALGHPGG